MRTDGLARHYGALTPRERVPLIVAANARGDEAEAARLAGAAPQVCYRLPDYHGLSDGLRLLALQHMAKQLGLAALHWRVCAELARGGWADDDAAFTLEELLGAALRLGRRFLAESEAWDRFCDDRHLDPNGLLAGLPGCEALALAERELRATTASLAEAQAVPGADPAEGFEEPTADDLADELHAALDGLEGRWR
jgi:hypothetical protein